MLEVTLKVDESYLMGQEILVEVEVTNTEKKVSSFHILTTASGKLICDFFLLTLNDTIISGPAPI